jgi:hypothetical protein
VFCIFLQVVLQITIPHAKVGKVYHRAQARTSAHAKEQTPLKKTKQKTERSTKFVNFYCVIVVEFFAGS